MGITLVFSYVITSIRETGIMADMYLEDYHDELENCHQTQENRKYILQKGCEELRKDSTYNQMLSLVPNIDHVWINKPKQLSICTPHKVGSQTWRYFFQQLDIADRNGGDGPEEH